jgi:hypothetical protein
MKDPMSPGATVTVSATTSTAATAITGTADQVRIYNAGSALVHVKFGLTGVTATTADMPIPSGAIEVFTIGYQTHVATITPSGTATIYFTRGSGI